jgi:phosphoglycerate kinase
VDHAVSPEFKPDAGYATVDSIPDGQMALDIGPKTIAEYEAVVRAAKTIIWNGPMGVFEMPPFDKGTMAIAQAVAAATAGGAISVVGGGDSEKAVKTAGISDKITHVSTGGGASLEFLSGIALPGVVALTDK